MTAPLSVLLVALMAFGCNASNTAAADIVYTSETLVLTRITPHVYQHTSYLQTQSFGKVGCNGMIVTDGNEAVIFDTPADIPTSLELINWIEKELKCTVKAIIPTHFHLDCLGGLEAFHNNNIPSYAHNLTIALAATQRYTLPKNGFQKELELTVGNKKVMAAFVGEGHTKDNIIGYFPDENILFGGCLVKELGAEKGNLEDANVIAWPVTMERLKKSFPDTRIIIPGHGKVGEPSLFDYTQQLFAPQ